MNTGGKKGGGLLRARALGSRSARPPPPTMAVATIAGCRQVQPRPAHCYRGGVMMNSQKKGFTFDGQAKLNFVKSASASDWFAVQDTIDPKRIRIKLN